MVQDASSASLAVRTARGAGWIIIWRMSTRLLGIASTVVLVRLLPPADFGLVALATSFSTAVEWLSSIGVNDSLVREARLDRPLYDTGFTLNLMRGLVMAIAIAAEAYPVATFFGDPRLANILLVLAVATFVSALENIGVVDFRRSLAFEMEFRLSVIPRVGAIIASIVGALLFRNYWALVVGIAVWRTLRLGLTYWMHPYRPRLTMRAWRQLIGFSFWSWLSAIVVLIRDRSDTVVIGRMFGAAMVGVYSVGWEIGTLTSTELVEPLTAALFAGFSEAKRTGTNVSEGFFKAISATFLLTLPMGVGMSQLADPVIHLAFGSPWVEAVPLVQVFALVCTLKVIAYFSAVLLNSQGLIHIQFRITCVSTVVRIALLFLLVSPFGLMGAAMAVGGCIAVEEVLFLVYTFRRFNLRAIELLRCTWRCVLATAVMAGVLYWLGIGWAVIGDSAGAEVRALAVGTLVGVAIYTLVLLSAWWAAGRPRGAETVFLGVLADTLRHVVRARRGTKSAA